MTDLDKRLGRMELKLDKLADAMVAMARAEEKLDALKNEHDKMYERVNRLSIKLDDVESGVNENSNTVKVINKLFWVAIIAASGAVAANIWM
jgi:predicted  nucleic acid-binding Zn-ribbon protein|tara:strand:- start:816 stop:1091 length:276 start_codon:yes stop_codon:yes gene_type:complete